MNKKITNQLEVAISKYVDIFCEKHELDFNYWVGGMSGTIGVFNDYFFSFDNVRLDLETDQPENQIFDWYEASLDENFKCNYKSWIMGFRPKDVKAKPQPTKCRCRSIREGHEPKRIK